MFSIINKFFRYGVEQIDVIQFDTQIQGEVVEMKRAAEYIQINGRGGTDFQPAADFYCKHKEYDGLIYFTDGFGPHPEFKERVSPNVLWIFTIQNKKRKSSTPFQQKKYRRRKNQPHGCQGSRSVPDSQVPP